VKRCEHRVCEDRAALEDYFRLDPYLHLYELGDLDPVYWTRCDFYTSTQDGLIDATVLAYQASPDETVVLALTSGDEQAAANLLLDLRGVLPPRFYAHLTPGIASRLPTGNVQTPTPYLKMRQRVLTADSGLTDFVLRALASKDRHLLDTLYAEAYPDNAFDPRTLEHDVVVGAFDDEGLCAVAGVHVLSEVTRVAALGNITTHARARRRGLATAVTQALCRRLAERVDHVGLNVRRDNDAAIQCYSKLGFEVHAPYVEAWVELL